jgi:hypothetical protein
MASLVLDANGKELKVGSLVRAVGYNSATDDPAMFHGKITSISDPDGDVDDHGRTVAYPPYITVLFDNGGEERYGAIMDDMAFFWDGDMPWECDDIELAAVAVEGS